MFIPLKYGLERATIGTDEFLIKCPSCESHQWADVLISSVYYHFYYIPIFPNDKDAFVCCKKCGLKRYGVPFNENIFTNYKEIKSRYRHPWYTYIGIAVISFPFVLGFVFWLVDSIKNK